MAVLRLCWPFQNSQICKFIHLGVLLANISVQGQVRTSLLGLTGCHQHPQCITLQPSAFSIFKPPTVSWAAYEYLFAVQNHFPQAFALLRMALLLRTQNIGSLFSNVSLSFVFFSLASLPGGCPSCFHFCTNHLSCACILSLWYLSQIPLNGPQGI